MTRQGSTHGRFTRAIQTRNLWAAETAMRELAPVSLVDSRGGYALGPGEVAVKTYRDVLAAYRCHPEPKSLAPDGTPCRRHTSGQLSRRPVEALSITHVGKEANLLEEIAAGLNRSDSETLNEYAGRKARDHVVSLACHGCGATLEGKQRRWCSSCRADHRRRIKTAFSVDPPAS